MILDWDLLLETVVMNLANPATKEVETVTHRFTTCEWVACLWAWLSNILSQLDEGLDRVPALEMLRFQYPKGLRERAVTWLLGIYIAIVTQEVVIKGRKMKVSELAGMLRYARSRLGLEAVQDVGRILDRTFGTVPL